MDIFLINFIKNRGSHEDEPSNILPQRSGDEQINFQQMVLLVLTVILSLIVVILCVLFFVYNFFIYGKDWRYVFIFTTFILPYIIAFSYDIIQHPIIIFAQDLTAKQIIGYILVYILYVYCIYRAVIYLYKNLKYYEHLYKSDHKILWWYYFYIFIGIVSGINLIFTHSKVHYGVILLVYIILLIIFFIMLFINENILINRGKTIEKQYKEYPEDEITLNGKSVLIILLFIISFAILNFRPFE